MLMTIIGAEDGRANPFDMGRVEIPRISVNISTAQEHLLRAQINPLTYSDYNGLDHYINVYYFLKKDTMIVLLIHVGTCNFCC